MRTAGIFEAKQNFSALVEAAEHGEEVRITRHGREVARLVPAPAPAEPPADAEIERELERMRRLRARVKPGPGWKQLRDDGRRF